MNSKMKGMAFALRAERKKTKMLEEEVKRLRETLTTLLNDCEMILDGDDMSGMSDQQLFGAMKSTILSGLEMIE